MENNLEFEPIPDTCQVCGGEVDELGLCDLCGIAIFNRVHTEKERERIENHLIKKHKL